MSHHCRGDSKQIKVRLDESGPEFQTAWYENYLPITQLLAYFKLSFRLVNEFRENNKQIIHTAYGLILIPFRA